MLYICNILKFKKIQMLPEIDINIIEASKAYRQYYVMIVNECIILRKKRKHSIIYLADELAVIRQRLSNFEKLKIHDMALASNYLEFYHRELSFTIKDLTK